MNWARGLAAVVTLGCLCFAAPGGAWAQSGDWTVMPMTSRGVEPEAAQIFVDLLQSELSTRNGAAFKKGEETCADVPCAIAEGKKLDVGVAVFGALNALGEKIIVTVTVVDVAAGQVVSNQKIKVNQIEDLDAAAERIAAAIVGGTDTDETAALGNITEQEARPARRREGQRGFGLRVGGLVPLSDGYADGVGGVLFDTSYWYETNQFAIEPRIGFRFAATDDDRGSYLEIPMDLGAYYLLTRSDFAPFIGGGAGLRYIAETRTETVRTGNIIVTESRQELEDSVFGFGAFARAGLLLFRTYTMRVAITADYNITFAELNGVNNPQSFTLGLGVYF